MRYVFGGAAVLFAGLAGLLAAFATGDTKAKTETTTIVSAGHTTTVTKVTPQVGKLRVTTRIVANSVPGVTVRIPGGTKTVLAAPGPPRTVTVTERLTTTQTVTHVQTVARVETVTTQSAERIVTVTQTVTVQGGNGNGPPACTPPPHC